MFSMLLDKKEGRGKKAFVEFEVVKIILIIFCFILLFVFIYKFYSKSTENAGEQACHGSIVLADVLAKKTGYGMGYLKPWPATCKTIDIKSKASTAEKAKKELAERMAWCYWTMGEGVINPLNKDIFYGGRKCFVCYTMTFPYLEEPVSREDFLLYLREKGNKGITYYDYLKYGQDKVITNPITQPIDNKKVYVVVYMTPAGLTTASFMVPLLGMIEHYTEASKEDIVYVADVNEGDAGCFGLWYSPANAVETA